MRCDNPMLMVVMTTPTLYIRTGLILVYVESESEVAQLCPSLWDPMDCSLPGFSVHGIFQARVLEWVAISFSRGSSCPRDRTQVSCIAGRCFTLWATRVNAHLCVQFSFTQISSSEIQP